ncbi:MAG: type II toxin-antitoxin system VapC family toxin [Acidobacteriota bacterium]|nr:type II toxin-antitoxin system VapC family toxin [Acidobacteriota bacterium]
MKFLLDTHILIWWAAGDRKLPRSLRDRIKAAENDVSVSAVTFWEIAIKSHLGRIHIDLEELRAAVHADGFNELPVQIAHTLRLQALPDHHRDPFDRLLIAQSIADGRRLVTRDESILAYAGVAGFDPLSK